MEAKDYTRDLNGTSDTQFRGVSSSYGRMSDMQNRMQPKYSEPGNDTGGMRGPKRNMQVGP